MRRFFWKIIMHLLPRHGRWRNMVSSRIVKRTDNLWMFTPPTITHYKAKLTGPFSNVSLLCVGTSHVENAINPEVMQIPTWNLGIRSGDLYTAYWLTKNTFMEGENKIIALGYDFWLQGAQAETSPMVGAIWFPPVSSSALPIYGCLRLQPSRTTKRNSRGLFKRLSSLRGDFTC